jgi:GMP synthase-like glutamine amidotransferase
VEFLISMGGPMSVYDTDEHPWIVQEQNLMRGLERTGGRMLGICLGAQLIASALGSPIAANRHKEIGWFHVRLTDAGKYIPVFSGVPSEFLAFHWHRETFGTLNEAPSPACTDACSNQAFVHGGRILGLQFHLEMGLSEIRALIRYFHSDLTPGKFVQPEAEILAPPSGHEDMRKLLFHILDRLAAA